MKKVLLLLMVLGLGIMSSAAPVFFDDFNLENGGIYQLNYTGFANWSVSGGTVDLIGVGSPWNYFPTYGLYVDMDGSTNEAGLMLSKEIQLQAGIYEFSYELAGNQRNSPGDKVFVNVNVVGDGGIISNTESLDWNAPFTLFSTQFTLTSPQKITISFDGDGGDNIGMLLDNVKLVAIPAPGAILLGVMGTSLVGWLRRRRSL
ncbi:MAG TPA: hypothetical protein PKB02_00320 [Anaerohalosphaeraceae bacterium]|nr:hypothetical protein [Anaerohalosphaeraceae bacterium]